MCVGTDRQDLVGEITVHRFREERRAALKRRDRVDGTPIACLCFSDSFAEAGPDCLPGLFDGRVTVLLQPPVAVGPSVYVGLPAASALHSSALFRPARRPSPGV